MRNLRKVGFGILIILVIVAVSGCGDTEVSPTPSEKEVIENEAPVVDEIENEAELKLEVELALSEYMAAVTSWDYEKERSMIYRDDWMVLSDLVSVVSEAYTNDGYSSEMGEIMKSMFTAGYEDISYEISSIDISVEDNGEYSAYILATFTHYDYSSYPLLADTITPDHPWYEIKSEYVYKLDSESVEIIATSPEGRHLAEWYYVIEGMADGIIPTTKTEASMVFSKVGDTWKFHKFSDTMYNVMFMNIGGEDTYDFIYEPSQEGEL